ncbi:MAG: hypothetical protein PUI49_02020 [Prevotellaceae bacterium]|nr:hypothetical protein [Prevotellaceae bacterium]MDY5209519.1 hypothetical protein [Prevotella sp.]
MAILNGILKKLNGSAGSLTFKQYAGQTVVSEKISVVKRSNTPMQMRQRTKWGNVIQMYKGICPLINYGFESKPVGKSDYNMFMKVNMKNSDIYLTREEVAGGACIAAPYQLTQGTLPSIVIVGSGENVRTDIKLGDLKIDANTLVKDFAVAVVSNNADYDFGDQISFFDVLQRVNAVTGIPYCQFLATNVVLDKASEVKLLDLVSKYGFATVDGFLGHIEGEGDGVYAWVHSRKSSAKTLVSTQSLINNNDEMIAEYSGNQAYKRSVDTYGGENSAFLTPGTTTTQATDGSVPPVDDSGSGGSSTDQGSGSDSGGSGSGSGSGGSSAGGSDSGGDEEGGGYYE